MAAPLGNRNAASGNRWKDAISQALKARGQGALIQVANALIDKALEGDMVAIKELGDRLDGKATQHVEKNVNIEKHIHHHAEEVTKNWLQSLIKAKADRDASIN